MFAFLSCDIAPSRSRQVNERRRWGRGPDGQRIQQISVLDLADRLPLSEEHFSRGPTSMRRSGIACMARAFFGITEYA